MRFTVLIPTFNNLGTIDCAIRSVQRQTERDFEIFVVGDGAPNETLELVETLAASDPRIRLFRNAKGERHGEAWRHQALQHATGEAVCYLSDDDFWLPDHLATMAELLSSSDFVHTRHTTLRQPWHIHYLAGDLADPILRQQMLESLVNICGLSFAAHRLNAYRSLPEGWAPASADVWTDLNMWRKWLLAPGIRVRSSPRITALNFPAANRNNTTAEHNAQERAFWYGLFDDPPMISALRDLAPVGEAQLPVSTIVETANLIRARKKPRLAALRRLLSEAP